MKILHISNTDIRFDNRIIKELESLSRNSNYSIYAIGIQLNENTSYSKVNEKVDIMTLKLFANVLSWLPRAIKYSFVLVELNLKLLYHGLKLKPDLVHCHDTMVLPAGNFIKKLTKAKLVYDAHELESNKAGQNKILSKSTLFIEKQCWPNVNHFITVSSSIIKWYNTHLGQKSSTLILNSPLISENYLVPNKYFHKLYNIPLDNLVFVYLGILGHGRGINLIIDAFKDSDINSHVVFVGYGKLEELIRRESYSNNNIHFHPPVSHEKVVPLVTNADFGLCLIENVSLSDYYCLPNKMFEYTFAGLPILASNFPDITEYVEKYDLGETCSVDKKSIKEAIKNIEIKPSNRIKSDLSDIAWEKQSEKLKTAYLKLLNI